MIRPLLVLLALGALCACSTAVKATTKTTAFAVKKTAQGAAVAASVPLEDLNIKRERIPKALRRLDGPYPFEAPHSCFMIFFEVRELNAALGPDADDPLPKDERSLGQKADDAVGAGATYAVRKGAASQIPFRDLVRAASGVNAHERELRRAYLKGVARRAYLRGQADARGCDQAAVDRELYEERQRKKKRGRIF
ncbi:hypothetical protein [Parvularcula dongshanensis]|uniref:DUF1318 domain-containing protein n=1 Tax=Parvularcula dongshanensis TaxID=1173995 RepID=A0A840I092_9PROT|nr:hypothetical protein [Parvularcula dongshanensis]MBB4657632.1 hypothetical protein [Parvularcula dongshanensis]